MVYMQTDEEVFDLRWIKLSIFCSVGFNFKTNKKTGMCFEFPLVRDALWAPGRAAVLSEGPASRLATDLLQKWNNQKLLGLKLLQFSSLLC